MSIVVLSSLTGAWLFWRRQAVPPVAAAPNALPPATKEEEKMLAGYGGSESCRECHRQEYDLWAKSNHGFAERRLRPDMDHAAYDPTRAFKHGSQTTEVRIQGRESQIVTLGFKTNVEPYRIERVIGHDPVRQFLTATPGGRFQVHEASYDPNSNQWFDVYGNEDRQPGEWGHWTGRGMNWNSRCADCHNTRLRKNYNETTESYRTTMAEISVGCEACHGPLKAHNEWQTAHPHTKSQDPTVVKMSAAQTLGTCGSCHSRRDDLTGDFKPGDSFFDRYSLEILDESERWYPDGQVKDEDYEFASFLSSKMHQSGVTCLDCHNAHSGKKLAQGNDLCMRCHQGNYGGFTNAPVINPVEHGHHNLASKGGECIGCHMPVTVYMQRHPRHDHGFTIPDPLLTKQLDIPNACNRCHADKSTDWALQYTEQWYGAKMNRHSRERAQWIAAERRGEDGAKDRLLGMLASRTENPYWRAAAAGLLWGWVNDSNVKTALIAALKDENPLVREKAVRSLEPLVQNGNADVTTALKPALEDPVGNVRVAAAWELRASVDPQSRAGLELQASLDMDADQPAGQYRKAMFNLARQQPDEAVTHLHKAIEWDPFSPPLRYETATVLSSLGLLAEAAEQLQVACRLEPQSADARFKLGLAWAEARDFDKAVEVLEETVKMDPKHTRAWYNLGLVHDSLGSTSDALAALAHAETLAPDDPQIPYASASILARVGRVPEARTAANRALDIQRDFKPALEMIRRLSVSHP